MACCEYCGFEMTVVHSCTDDPIVIGGRPYAPVRYGREYDMKGVKQRCHDCGVTPGSVHHHGCDMELCPACGLQSISCDCRWAGEELSEEELEELELEERFSP